MREEQNMGAPFVKAEKSSCDAVERYCEKHGAYMAQRAAIFGKEFFSTCPMCDEEQAAADEAEKKVELADEKALQFARRNPTAQRPYRNSTPNLQTL